MGVRRRVAADRTRHAAIKAASADTSQIVDYWWLRKRVSYCASWVWESVISQNRDRQRLMTHRPAVEAVTAKRPAGHLAGLSFCIASMILPIIWVVFA